MREIAKIGEKDSAKKRIEKMDSGQRKLFGVKAARARWGKRNGPTKRKEDSSKAGKQASSMVPGGAERRSRRPTATVDKP